jgi:hypothetical protein
VTSLAGGTGNPTAKFNGIGSKVAGTVLGAVDVQERDYQTKQPKTFPDGNPILQVRVTLEVSPGVKNDFYISGKQMKTAVRDAIINAGAADLEPMGWLEVVRTGGLGRTGDPFTYAARYVPFDPAA